MDRISLPQAWPSRTEPYSRRYIQLRLSDPPSCTVCAWDWIQRPLVWDLLCSWKRMFRVRMAQRTWVTPPWGNARGSWPTKNMISPLFLKSWTYTLKKTMILTWSSFSCPFSVTPSAWSTPALHTSTSIVPYSEISQNDDWFDFEDFFWLNFTFEKVWTFYIDTANALE